MSFIRYDEQEIIRKLNQLDPKCRVAFAAACAERQIPSYVVFSKQTGRGNPDVLIDILERVWSDLPDGNMPQDALQRELSRCMALLPQEEEGPWINEQAYAEDAVSAVAYALRARSTGDSQEAAYAARVAYEAVDHHVINRLGIESDDHVLAHPVVQAELARQHRDLDELQRANIDRSELFARLRERASVEAAVFFGPGS